MRRLLRELPDAGPAMADAMHYAVVVTPWLGSSVPWFTLVVGALLASRQCRVTFVLDDSPIGDNLLRYRFVLQCLRRVLAVVSDRHAVFELSKSGPRLALEYDDLAAIDHLARLNATWTFRGEMLETGREAWVRQCVAQLTAAYGPIKSLLRPGAFDAVFVPGGVMATSGLWVRSARAAGIRVSTFDNGGYGALMLACDGVACQLQDIPRAFVQIKQRCEDPVEREQVLAAARTEMAMRRAGTDKFISQVQGSADADSRFDRAVLIALNSSWDSAALGLHAVYKTNTDWIVETVRFLLEKTTAPVIVRQHPAERLELARTTDDYRSLLALHFGSNPRLHFVAAEEQINSYTLLEQVIAVVVYTSTIGTEACALGKPVITASSSYYSDLGFVWKATDLEDYERLLREAATGRLQVTEAMKHDAHLCYYVTQSCNWIFSEFNPANFDRWSRVPLIKWREDFVTQRIFYSLVNNVPVALLNHLNKVSTNQAGIDDASTI